MVCVLFFCGAALVKLNSPIVRYINKFLLLDKENGGLWLLFCICWPTLSYIIPLFLLFKFVDFLWKKTLA